MLYVDAFANHATAAGKHSVCTGSATAQIVVVTAWFVKNNLSHLTP